jgi:hypothetical protein
MTGDDLPKEDEAEHEHQRINQLAREQRTRPVPVRMEGSRGGWTTFYGGGRRGVFLVLIAITGRRVHPFVVV